MGLLSYYAADAERIFVTHDYVPPSKTKSPHCTNPPATAPRSLPRCEMSNDGLAAGPTDGGARDGRFGKHTQ